MKNKQSRKVTSEKQSLETALGELREHPETITLSGKVLPDRNFSGRLLVVTDSSQILSVSKDDIFDKGILDSGLSVLEVSASAQVWRTKPISLVEGLSNRNKPFQMEWLRPPMSPPPKKTDSIKATVEDIAALVRIHGLTKSIAGAASKYTGSCEGGDDYPNDCAHFLSDAFIRAGYTELLPPNDCINARCGTSSKRVIRARDMWCWFQKMATRTSRSLPSKDGFWAVFQLKEDVYWGGHVVIVDTDTGRHFGTGNYPNWDQYAYQW